MYSNLLLRVAALTIGTITAASSQTTASIGGMAFGPAGKPSTETLIRVIRVQPTRWTSPQVQTSATGSFTIPTLFPGDYVLCAAVDPVKLQIDPCFWLDPARKPITLTVGQKLTGQQVRLEAARKITVRIKDPDQLLKTTQPKPSVADALPRALKVELAGPPGGTLRDVGVVRMEPGGVEVREILVPASGATRLRVHAQSLILRDAQQRALTNSRFDQSVNQVTDFEFQIGVN